MPYTYGVQVRTCPWQPLIQVPLVPLIFAGAGIHNIGSDWVTMAVHLFPPEQLSVSRLLAVDMRHSTA